MQVFFLETPYRGKVELCPETLNYLKKKKYQKVALFASIQFCSNLNRVKEQLEELGISYVSSLPRCAQRPAQLLGCSISAESLNLLPALLADINCYLYIGDEKFHPLALLYGQKDEKLKNFREVVCNDPLQNKFFTLGFKEVKPLLKTYHTSLLRFLSVDRVGVIITLKPGQEQLKSAFALEKKYPGKKFFFFIDEVVSFEQLENFPFVQIWVNTACPRLSFDEQKKFRRGVINLDDALKVEEILAKDSGLNRF